MTVSAENIFGIVNVLIIPAWILLMFFPGRRWTQKLVMSGLYSVLYAGVYTLVIVINLDLSALDFSSLEKVYQTFANPYFLLAGWVHYLAFDLWVGAWILKDSQDTGIRYYLMLPILAFTFYLGPVGYLAYMVLKWKKTQ